MDRIHFIGQESPASEDCTHDCSICCEFRTIWSAKPEVQMPDATGHSVETRRNRRRFVRSARPVWAAATASERRNRRRIKRSKPSQANCLPCDSLVDGQSETLGYTRKLTGRQRIESSDRPERKVTH